MPRGRAKTPKAYGNRTDLNGPMAITAPTGQAQYGARAQQVASQEALRMGTPEVAKPRANANPLTPIGGPVVEEQVTAEVTAPVQRPTVPRLNQPAPSGMQITPPPMQTTDPDLLALKENFLPLFRTQAAQPGVPRQFRDFVAWLENS